MSEARKCDRCKGFYDIAEEQQDRQTPYEFKGDYINLHLWVSRNGVRKDVMSQWYDLCPKCMEILNKWLENPDNWKPDDCLKYIGDDDERVNNLYKEAEEISNNAGVTKEEGCDL